MIKLQKLKSSLMLSKDDRIPGTIGGQSRSVATYHYCYAVMCRNSHSFAQPLLILVSSLRPLS